MGILLMNNLMKIKFKPVLNSYLDSPVIDKQSSNHFIPVYLFILLITIGVTLLYYSKLTVIPINFLLLNVMDGIDIVEVGQLREAATTSFKLGKLHRYTIFMVQLLPFLVLIALFKTKMSKNSLWKLILFAVSIFTLYRCISDLQKGPILEFIILIFLALWIFKGRINWKQGGILIILIIAILCLMYFYIMGINQGSFSALFISFGKRLFITQTGALYHYFSLFPSSHDFLYGTSFPNPAGIFQFENFPLTKWIFINGLNRSGQIVGTAPSAFIGEIYANFGFPIMMLSILLLSMFLQFIQIKFISKPRTLLLTVFYTYFVFLSGQFAMTGIFIVVHLYLFIFLFTAIVCVDGYNMLTGAVKK
jgi:oligosaccharide repeat unit polymerase